MPPEGSKISFGNFYKTQPAPFVIYADFEAITEKIDTFQPPNDKSFTTTYQSHQACSYGYKVVCLLNDSLSKPVRTYRGRDAIEQFINRMFKEVNRCQNVIYHKKNEPENITKEQESKFQKSTRCYICEVKYKKEEINKRVRDYCGITRKYRGSAHENCSQNLRLDPEKIKIPVIFHNLRGYDSHFIMQKIGKMLKDEIVFDYSLDKKQYKIVKQKAYINIIANNFEKYISFSIGKHIQFIDSFQFMSSSLDKLSANLSQFFYTERETDGDCEILKKERSLPL